MEGRCELSAVAALADVIVWTVCKFCMTLYTSMSKYVNVRWTMERIEWSAGSNPGGGLGRVLTCKCLRLVRLQCPDKMPSNF